jgi:hypothetical protein
VNREAKWEAALEDVREHPFGQGLGSASLQPTIRDEFISAATRALDNSYLKIAFEQGLAMMVLFAIAMLLVFLQLVIGAMRAVRAEAAAMAAGASGALLSAMAVYYTGMEYEDAISLAPWMAVGLGAAFLLWDRAESHSGDEVQAERAPGTHPPGEPTGRRRRSSPVSTPGRSAARR